MKSAFYEGDVVHHRHAAADHRFEYRLFMVYVDLDELPEIFDGSWFWSARRPALAWLRRADFLGDRSVPLKKAVLDEVESRTGHRPTGPVRMLTHLRYFGLSFNPVSFYYCYDGDGVTLDTIVAEITNTPWNERHAYVLEGGRRGSRVESDAPGASTSARRTFHFVKEFHISPFIDMDCEYDWTFSTPGDRLGVQMRNVRRGDRLLDVSLALRRRAIDRRSCAAMLIRYPLMTAKVVLGIYWQALRLRIKGCPFYTHPDKRSTMQEVNS